MLEILHKCSVRDCDLRSIKYIITNVSYCSVNFYTALGLGLDIFGKTVLAVLSDFNLLYLMELEF